MNKISLLESIFYFMKKQSKNKIQIRYYSPRNAAISAALLELLLPPVM